MFSFFKRRSKNKDFDLNSQVEEFLSSNTYLSHKDTIKFKESINDLPKLLELKKSKTLTLYCKQNKLNHKVVATFVEKMINLDKLVAKHNDDFIKNGLDKEKDYLDNVLYDCDPNIKLDREQRIAVLSDEDYTLIIAGAGAGKTTTVAAKVKYLVDRKKVNPEEILVISFTNKAVSELKERINDNLKIKCPVTTFHSTGNAIIRKQQPEKLNIATEGFMYNIVNEYLQRYVLNNPDLINKLVLFFSYYLDMDLDDSSIDSLKNDLSTRAFYTLKSDIETRLEDINYMAKKKITINNERVKSIEEARIANFLYLNGIEYEYEAPYEFHIKDSLKVYTPDFTIYNGHQKIYLEHFGISESGENNRFTKDELAKYKKQIIDKKKLHQEHGTKLIYTFSKYNDNSNLLDKLKELLIQANVKMSPKSTHEIYTKLQQNRENRYFSKFIKLVLIFINNFKTNGFEDEDFSRLKLNSKSERNKVFLDITQNIYRYYQSKLNEYNLVDFQDMINESTKILKEVKEMKKKLNFKYIFVDEYQDISLQRFNLTKALSEVTDAKIIAVGDDWQSIYAFSGSRLELFTKFEESLGYAKILQITHTYRNSQELIDMAGDFVQRNDSQIKKKLVSPKSLAYPIAIFTYSEDQEKSNKRGKLGILEAKARCLTKVLKVIIERQKKEDSSILLLGRYGFDGHHLARTSWFYLDNKEQLHSKVYPKINLTFMTAHSSKGLGYDDVVIINGEDGLYGFPSQIKNDPVLNMVVSNDRSFAYAEERRLFYVALTRTKNRVYIISPENHPSRFIIELLNHNYKQLYIDNNNISRQETNYVKDFRKCPVCGFPMFVMDNKYYGRRMWICTNDQEICDFVTNDLHGGKTRIRKCPDCVGGYLFIKKRKDDDTYFLGCSNYKYNGKGCNHAEPLDYDSLSDEL